MTKQILLTVFLFVVALGSGIVVGWNIPHDRPAMRRDQSWLGNELKLSSEQREKMKNIWAEVLQHGGPRHGSDARRQFAKERDEAVVALLTPEQKTAYDRISEKYNQRVADLSKEREAAFQRAVEQTKAMLTPQQRMKYEEMLARGMFESQRRAGSRPSTTQAAVEVIR